MKKIKLNTIGEEITYEKLENGLTIMCIPKENTSLFIQ